MLAHASGFLPHAGNALGARVPDGALVGGRVVGLDVGERVDVGDDDVGFGVGSDVGFAVGATVGAAVCEHVPHRILQILDTMVLLLGGGGRWRWCDIRSAR